MEPVSSWAGIRVQDFRLFETTPWVDFAPLTLIFGKNNSGKTSLLRAPLLMRQLLSEQSATGEAPIAGPSVDFGTYRDLVRDGLVQRDVILEFALRFDEDIVPTSTLERILGAERLLALRGGLDARITLHWNKQAQRAQIQNLRFTTRSAASTIIDVTRVGPNTVKIELPTIPYANTQDNIPEISLRTIDFLTFPRLTSGQTVDREGTLLLYAVSVIVQMAFRQLVHIPPLREMPERAYRLNRSAPAGSIAGATIVSLARNESVREQTAAGLRMLDIATDVAVQTAAPGFANVLLTMPASRIPINLADVGFGASQVLPILVALAGSSPGTTLLIEQPELHLHPQAQVALADILVDSMRLRGLSLVVETHSEHVFLRLRRRVAEGQLSASDIAVYVVDETEVTRVDVQDTGGIDVRAFPSGFFEEEWSEAVELARAAGQRASRD